MDQIPIKVWQAKTTENTCRNYSIGEIISIDKNGVQVNTKDKILNIEKIQLPGKNILSIKDIIISKKSYFKCGKILS